MSLFFRDWSALCTSVISNYFRLFLIYFERLWPGALNFAVKCLKLWCNTSRPSTPSSFTGKLFSLVGSQGPLRLSRRDLDRDVIFWKLPLVTQCHKPIKMAGDALFTLIPPIKNFGILGKWQWLFHSDPPGDAAWHIPFDRPLRGEVHGIPWHSMIPWRDRISSDLKNLELNGLVQGICLTGLRCLSPYI